MFRKKKKKYAKKPKAIVQKITADATIPFYATEESAFMDLSTIEHVSMNKGEIRLLRTGLKVQCPPGYYIKIVSRSGLTTQGLVVANSPAIIDADYRGELFVIVRAFSPITISSGNRIAQMQFVKIDDVEIEEGIVSLDTERGICGIGSTGA